MPKRVSRAVAPDLLAIQAKVARLADEIGRYGGGADHFVLEPNGNVYLRGLAAIDFRIGATPGVSGLKLTTDELQFSAASLYRKIATVSGATVGSLIGRSGASLVLATNATAGLRAREVVVANVTGGHRTTSLAGIRLNLPSHGYGNDTDLWLSTAGAITTTEPTGTSVRIVQRVGVADGANHVILTFEAPRYEA